MNKEKSVSMEIEYGYLTKRKYKWNLVYKQDIKCNYIECLADVGITDNERRFIWWKKKLKKYFQI
jgi:hypothetical protein